MVRLMGDAESEAGGEPDGVMIEIIVRVSRRQLHLTICLQCTLDWTEDRISSMDVTGRRVRRHAKIRDTDPLMDVSLRVGFPLSTAPKMRTGILLLCTSTETQTYRRSKAKRQSNSMPTQGIEPWIPAYRPMSYECGALPLSQAGDGDQRFCNTV